jgi:hypothetical protein
LVLFYQVVDPPIFLAGKKDINNHHLIINKWASYSQRGGEEVGPDAFFEIILQSQNKTGIDVVDY